MPARSKLMIRFLLFLIKFEIQRSQSFITFIKEKYEYCIKYLLYNTYTDISQVNTRSCYRELEASVSLLAPFCPVKEVSSTSLGAAPETHEESLTFWQRDGEVHLKRQGQVKIKQLKFLSSSHNVRVCVRDLLVLSSQSSTF